MALETGPSNSMFMIGGKKEKGPDADRRARSWGGLFFFDVSQRQVDGADVLGQAADGDAVHAGLGDGAHALQIDAAGGFQLGGRSPSSRLDGDWLGGQEGRTLYVGKAKNLKKRVSQ